MTKGEVVTKVLAEVVGITREEAEWFFRRTIEIAPQNSRFDEEIPDTEAKAMLDGLRRESSGILAWWVRGVRDGILEKRPPAGSA
jgi:hypothetical protein